MAIYESEYTVFLREMMAKNPDWAQAQLDGMALLWDKKVSLAEQARFVEATVASKPYPYDVNFE